MDSRFDAIATLPENSVFKVVFFPDRVYHAFSLSATRSERYRYYVQEVRGALDICVMKGEVFLDGVFLSNVLRIEYSGERLIEQVREKGRFLGDRVMAWVKLLPEDPALGAEAMVHLNYDRRIGAYQVEFWDTLEPPTGQSHDSRVLDIMGDANWITRVPAFDGAMAQPDRLKGVDLAFRENDVDLPRGYRIDPQDAAWDNDYLRSHEDPHTLNPSDSSNTVQDHNYEVDFQRDFIRQADEIQPVRYRNPMMDPGNPDAADGNIIDMRWIFQRELGGSLVFFHEVTIPPGATEGTHQHIGTEELYYVVAGKGLVYIGENDNPDAGAYPVVNRWIYGLGQRNCREVPVKPGSVLFTKSGGIHGVRNPGPDPLKFVAFLYHTQ